MGRKNISKEWRKTLVNKLQARYGLTEDEATQKTEAWLLWIGKQPGPQPHMSAAEEVQHPSSRQSSLMGSSKSRSRSVGHS